MCLSVASLRAPSTALELQSKSGFELDLNNVPVISRK